MSKKTGKVPTPTVSCFPMDATEIANKDCVKAFGAIFSLIIKNFKTFNLLTAFSLIRNQGIDFSTVAMLFKIYADNAEAAKQIKKIPGIDAEQLYESNLI